jgi:hypothetical protein
MYNDTDAFLTSNINKNIERNRELHQTSSIRKVGICSFYFHYNSIIQENSHIK